MKLFLFALLTFGTVFSVCPNNCNSHGFCSKDGTCICQKQSLAIGYEKIYGYSGSDCSVSIYNIVLLSSFMSCWLSISNEQRGNIRCV